MAFDTYTAKMSPLDLLPGYTVKFEALSTTLDAAVAGVTVSAVAIYGLEGAAGGTGGTADELPFGPFMQVPGPAA